MKKEELEAKLNKEYKDIGVITITDFTTQDINVSELEYIQSIMEKIDGLDVDEPIVVEKHSWKDTYIIIDGYHRVKGKLQKRENTITAFVLSRFSIKRKADSLFSFLQTLSGKTIMFLDSNLFVVDGKHYHIIDNEGCGGCSNGWSSITVFDAFIGKKLTIKSIEMKSTKGDESDEYQLILNGKHVADVDTGWGNGYYGGDFKVHLIV